MLRIFLTTTMLFGVFAVSLSELVHAADTAAIQHALHERYQPSRMDVSNRALVTDTTRRVRAALGVGKDGSPGLGMWDRDGRRIWQAPPAERAP